MKILLTGPSSFTGSWFVRELASAGHEVVATFRSKPESYEGVRKRRVEGIRGSCRPVTECAFGDPRFLQLVAEEGGWDLLCHHGADVTDYKSPDFDYVTALRNNTNGVAAVLKALRSKGCGKVVITGSAFEHDEGAGSPPLRAFSPYGLSKGLTAQVFRYYALEAGMRLGKFVIPNPFGPYEDPRFTHYLMRCWQADEVASVKTPAYVRDNIHVSLLAKAYLRFVEGLGDGPGFEKTNPSGYVESQGAFTRRFAAEMRDRLGLACHVEMAQQAEFPEPPIRINTDIPDVAALGWSEGQAWDELADYYRTSFG